MVKRLIFLILILMMIFGVSVFRSIIFRSYFPEATSEEIKRSEVLAIAHRGASGHAPENTLAAIIKGVNMNADLVEIDVHLSKDREVVVFHDLTLNRTTNGSGKISETNWSDIEKLDAGSWFSEDFKEEKVPRLIDVLAYFKKQNEGNGKRVKLLIEIKNAEGGTLYKGLAQKTIDSFCGEGSK